MKTLFIPAKRKLSINETKITELSKKLPASIAIAYSIQYEEIASKIKGILSKTKQITNCIQVLGCSKPTFSKETKAILLISDGKFHATSLAREAKIPVYLLYNNKLEKIQESEVRQLKQKQKASYLKYLHADRIGIIASTKPGQQNLQKAIQFKKLQKKSNQNSKKPYLFIASNINQEEFQNFPQIQSWVNTACPRLDMSAKVINLRDLK